VAWLALATPVSPIACGAAAAQTTHVSRIEAAQVRAAGRDRAQPDRAARRVPPRLVDAQQKATHNSYARDEGLFDQLAYHRVRALELDIHAGKWTWPDVAGDWYVYHENGPGLNGTSCNRLSDCLADIAAFHAAVPDHAVITVFLDLKDDFAGPGHRPEDLDARLVAAFGERAIVRPGDLARRCPGATGVRDALGRDCAWPTLDELRGKLLFALTGGSVCEAGGLRDYATGAEPPGGRVAFVAPGLSSACPLEAVRAAAPDTAIVNLSYDELPRLAAARDAGLLSRVYYGGLTGGLDDEAAWNEAAAAGASYLATDEVNVERTPWASTDLGRGSPFLGADGEDPALGARARLIGVRVRPGGSRSGAFDFAYEHAGAGDTDWSAFVGVPSSHVEPLARACLMARSSLEPDAPIAAVCRPADGHAARLELRLTPGGPTSQVEATLAPPCPVRADNAPFVRLALTGPTGAPTAHAYASADGSAWTLVGEARFDHALMLQGLAATADRSDDPVRFAFGDVRSSGHDGALERCDALPERAHIGDGPAGEVFDGTRPP
jgi:hypothetical protein